MPKYHPVTMSHEFLTGMYLLANPSLSHSGWDCVPYDLPSITAINADEQAKKDITRTDWNFGKREKDRGLGGVDAEKPAIFSRSIDLCLFSWMVPEKQLGKGALHISDALNDIHAIEKLLVRAEELEQGLKKQKVRSQELLMPEAVKQLQAYLRVINGSEADELVAVDIPTALETIVKWMAKAKHQLNQAGAEVKGSPQETGRNLELSPQEAEALYAFSISLGNKEVVQGGTIRGVTLNCLKMGWLATAQGIISENTSIFEESHRLNRLPDGSISVSTYYSVDHISEEKKSNNKEFPKNKKKEILLQMTSDHQMTANRDHSEFEMKPRQQEVLIEESLWKNLLNRAKARLNTLITQNEVLRPSDFYALIPYLEDKSLRNKFKEVMLRQPDFVINFAQEWIQRCYGQTEMSQALIRDLNNNRVYEETHVNQRPVFIKSEDSANEYRAYLNHAQSREPYTKTFAEEAARRIVEGKKEFIRVMTRDAQFFGPEGPTFLAEVAAKLFLEDKLPNLSHSPSSMFRRPSVVVSPVEENDKLSELPISPSSASESSEEEKSPSAASSAGALSVDSTKANPEEGADEFGEPQTRRCSICRTKPGKL